MSETLQSPRSSFDSGNQIRPLSVRITEDKRAQLDIIAQLNDRSVTEEAREALEFWIERSKSDPRVLERAAAAKADIEREVNTKRGAIAAIFDSPGHAAKAAPAARRQKDGPLLFLNSMSPGPWFPRCQQFGPPRKRD